MILRGIDFGHVLNASGARNFFGDGWRQTRAVDFFGGWADSTFVAKTTTLGARMEPEKGLGNMRLDPITLQPIDWFPDCVWFDFRRGLTLNAVGLSGPGLEALLYRGLWQQRDKPFFISIMSVAATPEERLAEVESSVQILKRRQASFRSKFGLQINISCPNVGLDTKKLVTEAKSALEAGSALGVPQAVKFSVEAEPEDVAEVAKHPECDALCIGNTVRFGKLAHLINWVRIFGTADPKQSPLAKYGGGGFSGPPLWLILNCWLYRYRKIDPVTSISACGGIFSARDATQLVERWNVNAIEVGTVATHRPWRVQPIIKAVNSYFKARR